MRTATCVVPIRTRIARSSAAFRAAASPLAGSATMTASEMFCVSHPEAAKTRMPPAASATFPLPEGEGLQQLASLPAIAQCLAPLFSIPSFRTCPKSSSKQQDAPLRRPRRGTRRATTPLHTMKLDAAVTCGAESSVPAKRQAPAATTSSAPERRRCHRRQGLGRPATCRWADRARSATVRWPRPT